MAGICFYFEPHEVDVWSGHDLDAWNYAAKAAGDIRRMIVVNRTDQRVPCPDAGLASFEVMRHAPRLENAVYLVGPNECGPNSVSLWDFDHNVDWYVFGPAAGWGSSRDGLHVPQSGKGSLHSVHICSVVMMHRYHVRGR